jgi:hypothetical protein
MAKIVRPPVVRPLEVREVRKVVQQPSDILKKLKEVSERA